MARLAGWGAVWAGAGDLDGVGDVDKAMVLARCGSPAFDLWSLDFDGAPAMTADKVMVVVIAGTSAVESFAVVASEGVKLAGIGKRTHLVVDGGEGDIFA
jgi:hypothetical protein